MQFLFPLILAWVNKLSKPSLTGAGGLFINQNFSKKFKVKHLKKLIKAFNVDKKGTIKSYVDLEFWIEHKKFKERFYMTGLGKQKIILGFPWLNEHNPIIDWKKSNGNPWNLTGEDSLRRDKESEWNDNQKLKK